MERLKQIALELNAPSLFARIERADNLTNRAQTHVAVIGPSNSGKSTLINGILNQELLEPSLLPYQGKPPRVTFERMPNDDRFESVLTYHDAWSRKDVVLYEIAAHQICNENCLSLLDEMDVVFYVMSATYIWTSEDRYILKLMNAVPIQIVITQMDIVHESRRDQIIQISKDFCKQMGLAEPLFSDQTNWEALSGQMRDSLPVTLALNDLRRKHAQAIISECKTLLKAKVESEICSADEKLSAFSQRQTAEKNEERRASAAMSQMIAEQKLACVRMCNDTLASVNEIETQFGRFAQEQITRGKQEKFSPEFFASLQTYTIALGNEKLATISAKVISDVTEIVGRALDAGVMSDKSADALIENARRLSQLDIMRNAAPKQGTTPSRDSHLVPTALAVGVISVTAWLIPASPLITGSVIAAVTGAGGAYYYRHQNKQKEENGVTTTRQWVKECGISLQKMIFERVSRMYDAVRQSLKPQAQAQSAREDADVATQENETARLRALEREIQDMFA